MESVPSTDHSNWVVTSVRNRVKHLGGGVFLSNIFWRVSLESINAGSFAHWGGGLTPPPP